MKDIAMHSIVRAQYNWGTMFDTYTRYYGSGQDLFNRLFKSNYSRAIANSSYKLLLVRTPMWLIEDLFPEVDIDIDVNVDKRSDEHLWLGASIIGYIWLYGRTLNNIIAVCEYDELLELYNNCLGLDIVKTSDIFEKFIVSNGAEPLDKIDREIIEGLFWMS